MIKSDPESGAARRIRDDWRGLWGRGDSRLSPRKQTALARQLLLADDDQRNEDPACAICRLRVRSCHDWISHIPLSAGNSAGNRAIPASPYCPRHLRLLLDAPNGCGHLRELLPDLLGAAHTAVRNPHPTLDFAATLVHCTLCHQEDQTEIRAVHAAAQLPPSSTGTLPGLPNLDLCHEHTLLIAARIVGRLGPEPRAIPDLHMLLSSHRRRLPHLIAGDNRHSEQLGRAIVAVGDADAALLQSRTDLASQSPAPHRCTVCAAAAADTRALLAETTGQLIHGAHHPDHHGSALSLCRDHLRDLLNQARGADDTDNPTLLASIARAQLTELAPVLDWLDSGFGHPHTIRHGVAELAGPHACPACATHVEGQRHALTTLTTIRGFATKPDGCEAAICVHHSRRIDADHPARAALADALRAAWVLLQGLPPDHGLAIATAGGCGVSAPDVPTAREDALAHAMLIHGLGLLDGRIHCDTARASDDMFP